MTSNQAATRLVEMLKDAGVDYDRPRSTDVHRAWETMHRFAAEPVDDVSPANDSDGLLAQYGTHDWGEGEHFELDMTRQFAFDDDDGQYSHMSQLHCTCLFRPTDDLRALDADNVWSFGLTRDEFFARALALPGFRRIADTEAVPLALVVEYGEI
jgi:hypothetical protein